MVGGPTGTAVRCHIHCGGEVKPMHRPPGNRSRRSRRLVFGVLMIAVVVLSVTALAPTAGASPTTLTLGGTTIRPWFDITSTCDPGGSTVTYAQDPAFMATVLPSGFGSGTVSTSGSYVLGPTSGGLPSTIPTASVLSATSGPINISSPAGTATVNVTPTAYPFSVNRCANFADSDLSGTPYAGYITDVLHCDAAHMDGFDFSFGFVGTYEALITPNGPDSAVIERGNVEVFGGTNSFRCPSHAGAMGGFNITFTPQASEPALGDSVAGFVNTVGGGTFLINATSGRAGQFANGTVTYTDPNPFYNFNGEITCLRVFPSSSGLRATIGYHTSAAQAGGDPNRIGDWHWTLQDSSVGLDELGALSGGVGGCSGDSFTVPIAPPSAVNGEITILDDISPPPPDGDADGDGIADSIDTGDRTFSDGGINGAIDAFPLTYTVTVTNLPEPPDGPGGVHVEVTGPVGSTQKVRIVTTNPATGASCGTVRLLPGADTDLACGSLIVRVAGGSSDVEIELSDDTSLLVGANQTAEVEISAGSFSVVEISGTGGNTLRLVNSGTQTPVGESPSGTSLALYDFVGFSQPVDNNGVFNVAKGGSNVPLKWRLMTEVGLPVATLASAAVAVVPVNCDSGALDDVETVAANASGLQNLGDGYYQLNWKTPKTTGCYRMRLSLAGEGAITHDAMFKFK